MMKCPFRNRLVAQLAIAVALICGGGLSSAEEPPNVLDLPGIMQQQAFDRLRGVQLLQEGQRQEALEVFQRSTERMPHDPLAHYNLACAQALLGQTEPALKSLENAIESGFRSRQLMEKEPDLVSLRSSPRFAELLAAASAPPPKEAPGWKYSVTVAKPVDGVVTLQPGNMMWNQAGNTLQIFLDLSEAGKDKPVSTAQDEVGKLLKRLFALENAAGNMGDLYDNHDRGHSPLNLSAFPQFTRIEYGDALKQRRLDNGVQRFFTYTHAELAPGKPRASQAASDSAPANAAGKTLKVERTVVLGNSSTALTGTALWRSMPRLALTAPGGAGLLVQHYLNNHLYVYPEHVDHDPGHGRDGGWGDVFFANTPYYVISQGSSGTDQPFVQALAATLAAFRKDTKDHLRNAGLIAPTLQMILRRCSRQVKSDEDYLSGVAHPTVFDGSRLDPVQMVRMAHSLRINELPPLAVLKVDSEQTGDPRKDYFDSAPSEEVLASPFAIARACYSTQYWREMQVTATAYGQAKGSKTRFRWVVLRGDPELIEIKPVDGQPNSRTIRVGYHTRRPVEPGSAIESNRVDIGVFAYNGDYYSTPSFISFYFPDNEVREYDAEHRILSVDHVRAANNYADPAVVPKRDWRDEYHYDKDGTLTGWMRIRGEQREEFNSAGQLIVASDDPNAGTKVRSVRYRRIANPDGSQSVKQVVEGED